MNRNEWKKTYLNTWCTGGTQDNFKRNYENDWFTCEEERLYDWNNCYTMTKNTKYIPLVLELKNKELARITENKNIIISGTQKEFDELEKKAAPELKYLALLFKQILKLQGRK